jgi:Arc/MetJ-type ribon-helix-helix transcriptional regulator
MKTISVTIPEDLDARASAEAQRRGISKSELIRNGLTAVLPPEERATSGERGGSDPWRRLSGFGPAAASVEPGEVDAVVYRA